MAVDPTAVNGRSRGFRGAASIPDARWRRSKCARGRRRDQRIETGFEHRRRVGALGVPRATLLARPPNRIVERVRRARPAHARAQPADRRVRAPLTARHGRCSGLAGRPRAHARRARRWLRGGRTRGRTAGSRNRHREQLRPPVVTEPEGQFVRAQRRQPAFVVQQQRADIRGHVET